jgi:Ca-activated chloride channel homolog
MPPTDTLQLTCSLNEPSLRQSDQARLMYLLVEISGGGDGQTLPMNLGLIIDVSDSMRIRLVTGEQFKELAGSGYAHEIITDGVPAWQIDAAPPQILNQLPRRIDYLRDALINASEYLRATDRFSLVAFAGRAVTLIPTQSGAERQQLLQTAKDLEFVSLGDGTLMDAGMSLGLEELQRHQDVQSEANLVRASRLILLTDGHTLNVEACYAVARQARQMGLTISTMGLGTEFNEDLLIPLADMTGGHAYYIERPDQLPSAFHTELGAARGVRFRNLELKFRFPSGVELQRVHRVLPELGPIDPGANMEGSYALPLGSYDPSTPPALLLELLIPAWQAGTYRLAQTLLAWDDPEAATSGGMVRQNMRQDVLAQVELSPSQSFNPHVMNLVEKVSAFKLGMQALEEAQSGDRQAATLRLRQAATRLLDMGESALGGEMLRQAETLEKTGSIDPSTTKKLRYETRRITQKPG